MTRDEAMRAADDDEPTLSKAVGGIIDIAKQAGADAELSRVVEWLRDRAARTKVRRMRWILLWLAREIELGAHWGDDA